MKLHRSHINCTYLLDLFQYNNVFLDLRSLNWRQYFRGGLKCLKREEMLPLLRADSKG